MAAHDKGASQSGARLRCSEGRGQWNACESCRVASFQTLIDTARTSGDAAAAGPAARILDGSNWEVLVLRRAECRLAASGELCLRSTISVPSHRWPQTTEYYQLLKQAFEARSTVSLRVSVQVHVLSYSHLLFVVSWSVQYGPKLSLASFVEMLVESTMVEPEHETVCVRSFLQAQVSADGPEWELKGLVLCEFIEALSRVSVKIIENSRSVHFLLP